MFNQIKAIFYGFIIVIQLSGCTPTESIVQTGQSAEITFDGLHRVDGVGKIKAWVKPGVSLSEYNKILPIQTGIKYKTIRSNRSYNNEFEINDKKKLMLENTLKDAFEEELKKSEIYNFTNKSGSDVVILKAGLIDVVSNVPADDFEFKKVYIKTIGAATLVIELQDSLSGETLIRATERRISETPGNELQRSYSVTNFAEVKRDAKRWARSLREALDNLHKLNK
jgi:hypothetical protein